jgi:hypothetical protein
MELRPDAGVRRTVLETTKHLLGNRRSEQSPVTTADIAAETGLDVQLVCAAVKWLAQDHLKVTAHNDWAYAEVHSVERELD